MLFVHFIDIKKRNAGEAVIEVPYEIFRRLVTKNNSVIISVDSDYHDDYKSAMIPIAITEVGDKHFITFESERPVETKFLRYHYCIYLLKDI